MLLIGWVGVVVVRSAAGDAVRMLYGWTVEGVEVTMVVFEVAFLVEGRKGSAWGFAALLPVGWIGDEEVVYVVASRGGVEGVRLCLLPRPAEAGGEGGV